MVYVEALSKVLPVILLFLLGAFLNRLHFIRSEAIQDMKKLVLNVTLPAVLFLAFSRVSLEARHLLIVGIVFSACVVALLAGHLTIGCTSTPGKYTLPWLVGSFCEQYPDVQISVEVIKQADLVRKLEQLL
jgi:predicted permease